MGRLLSHIALDRRAAIAFGLPFILYWFTLAPTVYNLDSAEFSTAAATGGIMRATGYPLYLIVGWFWSHLPIGDVGYRMNLLSAVCGSLTILLVDRILRRWQVDPWAAFGALGLFACSTYFWGMSLIAEVYTLHTAFMAAIILWLFYWAENPTPTRLGWLTLTVGLGLGHHAATVLLIPGCVWFLMTVAPRQFLRPKSIIMGTVCGLLGLSIYIYLPLRYSMDPIFNYAGKYDATGQFIPLDLHTVTGVWWVVSGKVFADQMLGYSWTQYWAEVIAFGGQLSQTFFAFGLGPGLLGLFVLARQDWRWAGTLLLMFVVNAWFYIGYNVVDKNTMFLPTYLVWTIWLALGYQWLINWLQPPIESRRQSKRKPKQKSIIIPTTLSSMWERWVLRSAIVALVGLAVWWNVSLVNLADEWQVRITAEAQLEQVEPNALIFGWWDTIPPLEYLQIVEGQRPDVRLINRFLIDHADMRAFIEQELPHRPVYIDDPPLDFLDTMQTQPEAQLQRLTYRE